VIIALADSSVHCLNRLDCLKEVAFSSLNMCWRQDEPSNKYLKNSVSIAHMDLSWLGCVLLACDTRGNLYLYKLLPDGTTGMRVYTHARARAHTHTHASLYILYLLYTNIIVFINYFVIYVHVSIFSILTDFLLYFSIQRKTLTLKICIEYEFI